MPRRLLVKLSLGACAAAALALLLGCGHAPAKAAPAPPAPAPAFTLPSPPPPPRPPPERLPPVQLGIDVLESTRFAAVAGKRIGLLTHAAGVNRRGESTIDVLRRAPGVQLVALFAGEHGLWGTEAASVNLADTVDRRTGLPVHSLHGKFKKPTAAMLHGLDALVIDLQDNGSRSYTFVSAMLCAMAGCFENNVECIVLDRPNPLGGLKVDGPPLDADLKSYVGAFRVPYVHGLTIGELARLAKEASPGAGDTMYIPDLINVPQAVRARGRLTVIPMRGWTRAMRWPETGLRWIPTSPFMPDWEATVGYAMVGLGCQDSGWTSGIGRDFPFRGIGFPGKKPEEIIRALEAYHIPGITFVKRTGTGRDGKPVAGVYVEVTDWDAWHPTELGFYMQKQAALWQRLNPYVALTSTEQRTFKIHVGSSAWFNALRRDGGRINVPTFLANWQQRDRIYQDQARKYWLYP